MSFVLGARAFAVDGVAVGGFVAGAGVPAAGSMGRAKDAESSAFGVVAFPMSGFGAVGGVLLIGAGAAAGEAFAST